MSIQPREQKTKLRSEKANELQNMNREILEFQATREKQLQDQSVRARALIVDELNRAVAETPTLSGMSFVLDTSGLSLNGVPVVLYASPALERTHDVVKKLGVSATSGASGEHNGQGLGIATVDMKKVFDGYFKTKSAEDELRVAREAAKKDLERLQAVADSAAEAVKKIDAQLAGAGLSAAARSARTRERATRVAESDAASQRAADFKSTSEKQLQDQSNRLRAAIVDDINVLIAQGVKEEGRVNLIFDTSGPTLNGIPSVIHLDGIPDWTEAVLTTLNSRAPGSKPVAIGRANGSVSTSVLRFGFVDMARVFTALPATKAAEKQINLGRAAAKKEWDARAEQMKPLQEEVKKLDASLTGGNLSADARERTTKLRNEKAARLQTMDNEIKEFQKAREKQLQDISVKLRSDIVEGINQFLFERAAKSGYHVVFDSSGKSLNGVPVVYVQGNTPDLSNEVIVGLGGTVQ